jgi:CheY-like chemotaxis protein
VAKKVLVVDDNEDSVRILVKTLQSAGYSVQFARDGIEAILMIRNEGPDLVLLDIMMPRMDGFEVCQAVKANSKTKHIPIVMVTGKTDFDSRYKALKLGASDYLMKPIRPFETIQKVKTYLNPSSSS